jgi:hypothetical protein
MWTKFLGGSGDHEDRGWSIVVGADGHPVITGILDQGGGSADFVTRKLDSVSGSPIWTQTFPGAPTNIEERAGWLAVCDNDDIVMANRTWSSTTSYDVVLHRYAASDGDTVWTTRYGGEGTSSDNPRHMARHGDGGLLVAGVQSSDYMVLKFDPTGGTLLWSSPYDGPGNGYDSASWISEGPGGEVIVTGFTTGDGTSWDATTLAFESSTGDLQWDEHYDSGLALPEEGGVLAVSAMGDIYTVGYGYTWDTDSDLLSIRYLLDPTSVVEESALPRWETVSAAPNPFAEGVRLSFELPVAAGAHVAIFDATGRRIIVRDDVSTEQGVRHFYWNGRDDQGRRVAPGVYFVRIESAGVIKSCRVEHLR